MVDVNILGWSIHTVRKNTEAAVITRKEIGLEVNAEKTKYMKSFKIRMHDRIATYR